MRVADSWAPNGHQAQRNEANLARLLVVPVGIANTVLTFAVARLGASSSEVTAP
jgi:hypothetical protein